MAETSPRTGYRARLFGPVYQAGEDGRLRMIDGTEADLTEPIYWVPADVDHDQGDDPSICANCGAGRHGRCHDLAERWQDAEPCECTDGECGGGEWVDLGYVEESGAAGLRAEEQARQRGESPARVTLRRSRT